MVPADLSLNLIGRQDPVIKYGRLKKHLIRKHKLNYLTNH